MPGLIDAHGHVMWLGKNLSQLDLRNTTSLEQVLASVKAFGNKNDDGWIIGSGWNQENWPGKTFPSAADLDSVFKDRPIMLTRVDVHAIWVNSKALELAGIAKTPAPKGGEIIRLDDGRPSGILIDNAQNLC